MAGAVGKLTKVGIDSANPVTARFDFKSFDLRATRIPIDANGMRGDLDSDISRVRDNLYRVNGTLVMEPNAVEWALLWPWILGTAGSGGPTVTFARANSALTRYVALDYNNGGSLRTFAGVAVNRATITCGQGQPLRVSLDLLGQTETVSGSFPAINIPTANGPYVFSDSVGGLVVGGVTVTPKQMSLVIDNHLDPDRFFNGLTLASIVRHDFTLTLGLDLPDGDFDSLYNQALTGINTVFTFTNGGAIKAITMPGVVYNREGPTIPGIGEIMLPINGRGYKIGGVNSITVTQNPGP